MTAVQVFGWRLASPGQVCITLSRHLIVDILGGHYAGKDKKMPPERRSGTDGNKSNRSLQLSLTCRDI